MKENVVAVKNGLVNIRKVTRFPGLLTKIAVSIVSDPTSTGGTAVNMCLNGANKYNKIIKFNALTYYASLL